MTIKELARLAMDSLENLPCGGIGEEGPTQEELGEASEDGMPYDDDTLHHQSQQAWLHLKKILEFKNAKGGYLSHDTE